MTRVVYFIFLIVLTLFIDKVHNQNIFSNWFNTVTPNPVIPVYYEFFCKNNFNIAVTYSPTVPISYFLWSSEMTQDGTEITIRFDSEPTFNLVSLIIFIFSS